MALIVTHHHLAMLGGVTLSEADFMQKFKSNQISHATITINPGGTVTINGKFFETDNDGKTNEVAFVVRNVMLNPTAEDQLVTSDKIDVSIPNPMVSDIGYQLLFFGLYGVVILLVPGIIVYVIWRALKKPADPSVPPGQKPDRFWRRFAVVVLTIFLIPFLISILGIFAAMFVPAFVKAREHALALHQQQAAHESNTVTISNRPSTPSETQSPALTTSQVADLQKVIAEAEAQNIQREAQLAQLSAMNNEQLRKALPGITADKELVRNLFMLKKLQSLLAQVKIQGANDTNAATEQAISNQIAVLNGTIDDRMNGILIGMKSEIKAQEAATKALANKLVQTVATPPLAYNWTYTPTNASVPEDDLILAEQPPVVVETFPVSGARDVVPGDVEIRVRFSKDMTDGSWSWSTAWENSVPKSLGPPHYLDDHRTCVIKVHLEPGKTYAWWLNSNKFKGFTDAAGQPSVPYLFSFQTKSN
jgi:hypothetical protein